MADWLHKARQGRPGKYFFIAQPSAASKEDRGSRSAAGRHVLVCRAFLHEWGKPQTRYEGAYRLAALRFRRFAARAALFVKRESKMRFSVSRAPGRRAYSRRAVPRAVPERGCELRAETPAISRYSERLMSAPSNGNGEDELMCSGRSGDKYFPSSDEATGIAGELQQSEFSISPFHAMHVLRVS
jgi:hypothetical protein